MGELLVGLNFGPLLLLGTYYVQTHTITAQPIIVGIPLGVLTAGILYVNEFPDTEADVRNGRYHLVARWGKARAAKRFKALVAVAYAVPIVGVLAGLVTPFALISLATLPKALTTSKLLGQNYDKVQELIPAMASMVMTTLLTGILFVVAYLAVGLISLA